MRALILIPVTLILAGGTALFGQTESPVTFNGKKVPVVQLKSVLEPNVFDSLTATKVLRDLVARDSIKAEAAKAGVESDPAYIRQSAQLVEQFLVQKWARAYEPTDSALRNIYEDAYWLNRPTCRVAVVIMAPQQTDVESLLSSLSLFDSTSMEQEAFDAKMQNNPGMRVRRQEIYATTGQVPGMPVMDTLHQDPVNRLAATAAIGKVVGPNKFASYYYAFKVLGEMKEHKTPFESAKNQLKPYAQRKYAEGRMAALKESAARNTKIDFDITELMKLARENPPEQPLPPMMPPRPPAGPGMMNATMPPGKMPPPMPGQGGIPAKPAEKTPPVDPRSPHR